MIEYNSIPEVMILQIPICAFDAKIGILCSACDSKLRSGQIRDIDIQVSKALIQLAGQLHGAGAVSLVRSFCIDGTYILELEHSGVVVFRNNQEFLSELEKLLGGRVWLARASSTNRDFIEDLLHPIKVLSLSTIWLPDGSKVAKAVVGNVVSPVMARRLETVKKIMKEVRGMDLVVESANGQAIGTPPVHKRQIVSYEASPADLVSGQTHRARPIGTETPDVIRN
jgi:transcription antitermination factor NusA-like protein